MIEFSDDLLIHGIRQTGNIGSTIVDAENVKGMDWEFNYNWAVNNLAYFTLIAHKEPLCGITYATNPLFSPYTIGST